VRARTACLLPLLALLLAACGHGAFQVAGGGADSSQPLVVNLALPGEDDAHDIAVAAAMEELGVPSVSLAVIEGGSVAWTRTWGEGIGPTTPFQAGAMAQPVAAAAALSLVEEGYLTLDDDVGPWIEGWRLAIPGHPVTLRNLMSMTAGFTDPGFEGYPQGAPLPTLGQILAGAAPAQSPPLRVENKPGTAFAPSDSSYVVLEAAMQGATGVDFAEIARARVLVPVAMQASSFEQPAGDTLAVIAARGHDDKGRPIPDGWLNRPARAADGLWSTPADLAAFLIALGEAKSGRGDLLGTASMGQMLGRQNGGPWGLGLALAGEGASLALHKGGSGAGYSGYMVFFPASGQGAVVMTGGDNGRTIAAAILDDLGATYPWPWNGELAD
jgi:CubicO group peptidase (beta-lactamase class C family)